MAQPQGVRFTPGHIFFLAGVGLFFGCFLIYPLFYVFVNAFYVNQRFTLTFFALIISNAWQWQLILNSINLGLLVTLLTTVISLPLAWVMVRYEFPGKALFSGLILVPMVLPPFVGAVGMRQMFARFGSINLLLMQLGIIQQPIDWFGSDELLGLVILQVLHLYPIMYLNVAAALGNLDPNLEESARNVGAHGLTLFRKITFPLLLPGYFAGASIVFIWSFTDLGTPLIFDYRQVVAVQIFDLLSNLNENPMAYVLVVLMIGMTLGFFYLTKSLVGSRRYETLLHGHVGISAKRASKKFTSLIYCILLGLTLTAMIPHLSVILTSISERWFMTVLPEAVTDKYYHLIFAHRFTSTSIQNSLLFSGISTIIDIVLGIMIAYLLARTRMPGKNILDTLTMLPLAIPGIIIAFGYLASYSGTFLDARGNPIPLLVCAYAMRRLPYMVRAAYAGFQQTSITLEEAAQNVGAGPLRTLRRITLPLILANLVAGGILCFAFAMLEVSDSLILAFDERFYPITKAIYLLLGRPDGPYIASALGVLGMILLIISLLLAGKFLGRRMGELFRI
ncbi:iron ABC transporter permease [candidate division KSB1 bacterium]|nr:iron ABC transporter permease [candidate division KSB1 bacterium]